MLMLLTVHYSDSDASLVSHQVEARGKHDIETQCWSRSQRGASEGPFHYPHVEELLENIYELVHHQQVYFAMLIGLSDVYDRPACN
jgi:hypothetical protein